MCDKIQQIALSNASEIIVLVFREDPLVCCYKVNSITKKLFAGKIKTIKYDEIVEESRFLHLICILEAYLDRAK